MTKKVFLYVMIVLLFLSFFGGMKLSYDLGFYKASIEFCEPLTAGIDVSGNFVCFNKSEQITKDILINHNFSLGVEFE